MVKKKDNGGDDLSTEKRCSIKYDIHRKLPHVRSRADKLNDALDAAQEFSEKGASLCVAKNKTKSKELYQNMYKTAESESEYIRKLLADIQRLQKADLKARLGNHPNRTTLMQAIQDQGAQLPLWVSGGVEEFPPPYVGAIWVPEAIPLKEGDSAAAFAEDNWILAEVLAVTPTGRYEMRDVDSDQKVRITISRKRVIPLPKWRADPERDSHALFPVEAIVLALYPQTTCFYKGVVVQTPKRPTDDYHVTFEDSSYASGYSTPFPIPQRYIVSYKDVKSKKRRDDDETD